MTVVDDQQAPSFSLGLVATGITVMFGGVAAVSEVSISLVRNEVVGLLGPNGAGKTTLVNVVTGFQSATAGTVTVDGVDITRFSAVRRSRVGLTRTFQGSRTFKGLSVLENVAVSGVGRGLSRREAERNAQRVLDLVGLSSLGSRQASDLTTGQERRIQLARAIASEPKYLFLDEPAAGLNETESQELRSLIRLLPEEVGCGVILIEHDVGLVMDLADRIIVLDNGKIIAEGKPETIRRDQRVIDAYLGS